MCEIKNVPACHAERVYDTSFVAANHQRSISSWNVLSSQVGVPALRALLERTASLEQQMCRLLEAERTRAWRNVRWPVRDYDPALGRSSPLMLRAEYRLVPYGGERHEQTRDELLAWARGLAEREQGCRLGLRLYVGPGGAGKTRLLIEAGEALRATGWIVGFLADAAVTRENAVHFLDTNQATLLILDYAGARSPEVEALLAAMARGRHRREPFALVLLDRAEPSWFLDMVHSSADPGYTRRPELLALETIERAPLPLPTLADVGRAALFRDAVRSFQQMATSEEARELPTPNPLPERPLFVLLLALLSLAGERLENSADEEEILRRTWGRERELWRRRLRAQSLPGVYLQDALNAVEEVHVLLTLGRPFARRKDVLAYLSEHFPLPLDAQGQTAIAMALCPAESCSLLPIEPDPLADYAVERQLSRTPELLPRAFPSRAGVVAGPEAAADQAWRLLLLLQRIAAHPRTVSDKDVQAWIGAATDRLARLFAPAEAGEGAETARSLWTFLDELARRLPVPDRTLALRAVQEPLYRGMAELAADDAGRARALIMLGNALSALGRREEALAATQEAVDIRRGLAQANPQAFLPDLAMSLTSLGNRLSELGRREEALAATQEAADIRRRLAQANPQAFLPDLAKSLNNLGDRLSEVKRSQEALEAYEEAVRGLAPFFLQLPAAFADRMLYMARDYFDACQAAGREPDGELLGPVVEALAGLAQAGRLQV
jgi:tetratricopeptide (TPR) repeat protein